MSEEASETYAPGSSSLVPAEVYMKEYDPALDQWRRKLFLNRVLLEDSFQETDKWTGQKSGTGSDYVVDGDYAGPEVYFKDKCMQMKTRATAPAAGDYVSTYRVFVVSPKKKVMVFWKFRFESASNFAYIEFDISYYDSAKLHDARIRYDVQNNKWQYLNSSNAWTDSPVSATQKLAASTWHQLYLAIDLANLKYIGMWCAGYSRDLSACGYYNPADAATREYAKIAVRLENVGAVQITGYLADLLITELPV